MNLLIIGYVWPEPKSSAAGYSMLSLIQLYLAQGWLVTYASPAELSTHMADLDSLGVTKCNITLNSGCFDEFITELNPNMVVFDRFMMEEQFAWRVEKCCPDAIRVLQTEDLQHLRGARHQAVKQDREVTQSDLFSALAKREIAAILRSDLSFVVSDYEMSLLTDTYKIDPSLLLHTPFMLPQIDDEHSFKPFDQRQDFICIGSFRHAPNWDSVLWLSQEIWPKIRKKLPNAQLNVCGSYPPKKATQLHDPKKGFIVKGWVDDALLEMENAKVCLAPIRFGAGIKGKLVDAMQAGTPSVTTTVGAEGMTQGEVFNCDNWCGAIEDEVDAFVTQAVTLYEDQDKWLQAQSQGIKIVNSVFDGTRIGDSIVARIKELAQSLEQHRLNNFTGAMLRHHSMKSTKYMSQWIEEKNKTAD